MIQFADPAEIYWKIANMSILFSIIAIGFILWLIYSNLIQKRTIVILAKTNMQLNSDLESMTKSHEEDHIKNHGCKPGEGVHPAHLNLMRKNQMSKPAEDCVKAREKYEAERKS